MRIKRKGRPPKPKRFSTVIEDIKRKAAEKEKKRLAAEQKKLAAQQKKLAIEQKKKEAGENKNKKKAKDTDSTGKRL